MIRKSRSCLLIASIISVALVFLGSKGAASSDQDNWRSYVDKFSTPVKQEKIEEPKVRFLDNGIKLLLIKDRELPLVSIYIALRGGTIYDDYSRRGLATLAAKVIRSAGTEKYSADEIDLLISSLGADIEILTMPEYHVLSANFLSKDFNKAIDYIDQIVFHPRFDKSRFLLERDNYIDDIRRLYDDPSYLAMRELRKYVYKDRPFYSYTPDEATLRAITLDDLKRYYSDIFLSSGMVIGVSGYFDEDELVSSLNKSFGKMKAGRSIPFDLKNSKEEESAAKKDISDITIVDMKKDQSVIRIGRSAWKYKDSDYYPMLVLDNIFGRNSFSSRLVKSIRVNEGLSYSVWSYYLAGMINDGAFYIGADTRTAQASYLIRQIENEIQKIVKEGITHQELDLAKESIINSFVLDLDRSDKLLARSVVFEYYHYDGSYIQDFRTNVAKVTLSDLESAARKLFAKDGYHIVVVGDKDALLKDLEKIGNVDVVQPR